MGFVYLVLVMTSLEGSMRHRGKAAFLCRFQGVEVSRCRGVEVSRCRGVEVSRCRAKVVFRSGFCTMQRLCSSVVNVIRDCLCFGSSASR